MKSSLYYATDYPVNYSTLFIQDICKRDLALVKSILPHSFWVWASHIITQWTSYFIIYRLYCCHVLVARFYFDLQNTGYDLYKSVHKYLILSISYALSITRRIMSSASLNRCLVEYTKLWRNLKFYHVSRNLRCPRPVVALFLYRPTSSFCSLPISFISKCPV